MSSELLSNIINNKYQINIKIGNGKFGDIYLGTNLKKNKKVVIKLENTNNNLITLKNEATILKYLYENGCHDIPIIYWYGMYSDYISIIIPKYECSLYEYVLSNDKTQYNILCEIIVSMISIINNIHDLFVIHRDIKPQHFMLKNGKLYLIDFGISTFYIDENKKLKRNELHEESIIGSSNYASINLYNGNCYSRRDDLISVCYIIIFLFTLELPWENISTYSTDDKYNSSSIHNSKNVKCKDLKILNNVIMLCNSINNNLALLIHDCYSLDFYDEPNYIKYISYFHT
jgi:serine/threonine protein kinase